MGNCCRPTAAAAMEDVSCGGAGGWGRRRLTVLEDGDYSDVKAGIEERYQMERELGRGEFGVTYLCVDRDTREALACKSIPKRKLRDEVDVEDVRREVAIMRHLPRNPGIVGLREACEDHRAVHLVMELCEGGELFDRILARGHYTERAAAAVARTVVEVVQLCHAHGVIHRDLKPENFLFANDKESSPLKAIDFGLSIFFKPESEQGVARAILRGIIDFKRDPWPSISEDAKNLVQKMLEPDPELRLSAKQVLEHPWLQDGKKAPDVPLGNVVTSRLKQFSMMSRFKRRALRVIADHLSIEEVEDIKEMFTLVDTDNDGIISCEELKSGLGKYGSQLAEVQMLIEAVDTNERRKLASAEFLGVYLHLQRMANDEHLRHAFAYFDKDGNGYIEVEELREVLMEDGAVDVTDVANGILQEVDTDKDGRISYDEFVAMMKTGTDWRKASRHYSRGRLKSLSARLMKDGSLNMGKE